MVDWSLPKKKRKPAPDWPRTCRPVSLAGREGAPQEKPGTQTTTDCRARAGAGPEGPNWRYAARSPVAVVYPAPASWFWWVQALHELAWMGVIGGVWNVWNLSIWDVRGSFGRAARCRSIKSQRRCARQLGPVGGREGALSESHANRHAMLHDATHWLSCCKANSVTRRSRCSSIWQVAAPWLIEKERQREREILRSPER